MTNLLYRASSTSTPPVSSLVKGSPLTTTEFDANLKSISDDIATKAPIASPTFTGTPAVPTATAGTSTTQVASTAFVLSERTTTSTLTNKTLTNPAGTTVTLTDGANVSWDMNLGQLAYWSITGTGRTLLAPTNFKHGVIYTLMVFCADPATQSPTLPTSAFKFQYNIAPDFTTSTCTILSIIWSPIHNKFIVFPAPGL